MEKNNENTYYLCAAFCGTGKSFLCDKFPDIYKEIECWKYRKGDFPKNYIQEVINKFGKVKYLFISTDPIILKELNYCKHKILYTGEYLVDAIGN